MCDDEADATSCSVPAIDVPMHMHKQMPAEETNV